MRTYRFRITISAPQDSGEIVQIILGADSPTMAEQVARWALEDQWFFIGNDQYKIALILISYELTGEVIKRFEPGLGRI